MNHANVTFVHPGTFMSPETTRGLKHLVDTQPERKKALDKLIKETPLNHVARPLEIVDIGYGGGGKGHAESTKDAEIAVSSAILFWATHIHDYALLAIRIIKAWATTNKVWRGDNGLLEASWVICSMARAAELVKHSIHANAWKDVEPAFFSWIDKVIMPVLRSEHIWTWTVNNWHFSQICARMQLAILREDQREFQWCITRFPEALKKALIFKKCPGETTETCRDITHNQFQLGGIVQAAEMALHQGVASLYDDRIRECFELQAAIMMKEVPQGLTKDDIKTPNGYWYEPVWHIPYAHFVGRKGMSMPKTKAYLKQLGVDRVCFHWGPNCLTHYIAL